MQTTSESVQGGKAFPSSILSEAHPGPKTVSALCNPIICIYAIHQGSILGQALDEIYPGYISTSEEMTFKR